VEEALAGGTVCGLPSEFCKQKYMKTEKKRLLDGK
jgi:hypothetical protein